MSITYNTGTITLANGSTSVTGSGTAWVANVQAGWWLIRGTAVLGIVESVNSDTSLTLVRNYEGAGLSGDTYDLVSSGAVRQALADKVQELIDSVQAYVDGPLSGLFGAGTLAEPGIAFAVDPDTGLRRSGTNAVALVAGGADQIVASGGVATGAAVQSSNLDATAGKLLTAGAFGIGTSISPILPNDDMDDAPMGTFCRFRVTDINKPGPSNSSGVVHTFAGAGASVFQTASLAFPGTDANQVYTRSTVDGTTWTAWAKVWNETNTTVDGSGNIVEASPILRVFDDGIEEPAKPVGATMQRLGMGHYKLTGTPPLATTGWQVRAPEGCEVAYLVWRGTALHLMLDRDGVPADVPDGSFAMLRFWEGDGTPPAVQSITQAALDAIVVDRAALSIKAECRAAILSVVGETAQANIAQAGVLYAGLRLDGATEAEAQAAVGLAPGDLTTAAAWKAWVADMQTECRRAIQAGDDPTWPAVPAGVAEMAARF